MDDINELQASQQQKRMFFALCNQLGMNPDAAKESVKRKFKLESFANITKDQLSEAIDILSHKADDKTKAALIAFMSMNNHVDFALQMVGEDWKGEKYEEFIATELLKYFVIKEKV